MTPERCIVPNARYFYSDRDPIDVLERMLAQLLLDDVLFTSERNGTVCISVNCNDIFAWACADSEDVPEVELPKLYDMQMANPNWGAVQWCVLQRKQMPQPPVLKMMTEQGAWPFPGSETVGPNTQDAETKALFAQVSQGKK